jgi:glucuronoarabinoxylan endo-1,4-beta-xylanase
MKNKFGAGSAGAAIILVLALFVVTPVFAGTASIDATTKYQTISGFGASSQWVESKITSALATEFWADDQVNGHAGLSIIRIGVDDSGNSNWGTACGSATQALNINPNVRVFASPWSPPAKWKNNNSTSGNNTGNDNGNPGSNSNQLSTSHYGDYATYLTNFVTACKNTYKFNLYALSVQNEPDYDPSYDACLWSASNFDSFIGTYLGPDLAAAGFNNIVMMPESFACNFSLAATTMGDSNAAKYVRCIGMHLYGGGPNPMPASYSTTAGHTVEMWETETSEKTSDGNIDSGIYYANQLHKCIVDNNYNAYCYWWLVNTNSDDEGLCDSSGNPTKRLYTLGNYSKFIKPGAVRIACTENPSTNVSSSAYIDTNLNRYVIVCVNNNSSAQSTTFNLSGISTSSAVPWITDASNNLVQQSAVAVSGNSFTFNLPANSVMSFVGTMSAGPSPTNTPFAGTPTFTATASPTPHSILLDDMEDGDNINNWGGNWYDYSGTGTTITPVPYAMTAGGMPGSPNYRAEIQATVADYAGLGTNLNSAQTAVDLSLYTAVQFYVKGNGGTYWFQFVQPSITDGDNFGVSFTAPSSWTLVTVPIDGTQLAQRGFGTASTFTKNAITALQWQSNSNGALDIQVDNVQFLTSVAMSPTNTPVPPTKTITPSPTATLTRTPTATSTRTNTYTATVTSTSSTIPTATFTQSFTATDTKTSTPVAPTSTSTSVAIPTSTSTSLVMSSPTNTFTLQPQPTGTFTYTEVPATPTFTKTPTQIIPTATNTQAIYTATNTAVIPTATNTAVMPPASPTFTSIVNTATYTFTVMPDTATFTPVNTFTATVMPTSTYTTVPTSTSTQPVPTFTYTLVPTSTNTAVPPTATKTFTLIPTPTYTFTAGPVITSIDLQLKEADNSNSTNSPHPQIRIINTGNKAIDMDNVEARYWFNCDCTGQALQVYVDWAGLTTGAAVTQDVIATIMPTSLGNQSNYISFKFTGGIMLAPNGYIEIQSRFNKSDWSPMVQSNDWSYTNTSNFIDWTKITGYINGSLVFGQEPGALPAILNSISVMTYPNPATQKNPVTIKYTITAPGISTQSGGKDSVGVTNPSASVELQIFTISGRLVWEEKLTGAPDVSTGEHVTQWNSAGNTNFATGIYTLKATILYGKAASSGFSRMIIFK